MKPAACVAMRALIVALFAVLSAACAGPPDPLDVGVREFPSDVILGEQARAGLFPPPIPPTAVVLTGPIAPALDLPPALDPLPQPQTGTATPTTAERAAPNATHAAVECQPDDPLAVPAKEATNRITTPPPEGRYPFRNAGTFRVSGFNPREGAFPTPSHRTVQAVRTTSSGFTYEVAAELGSSRTTTAYEVVRDATLTMAAGLYLLEVTTTDAGGVLEFPFRPTPPLKLVDLPAVPGTTFTTAGTDPTSGTTMSFTSTVGPKTRVDACGTPLDAITLTLKGRLDSADADVDFELVSAVATQFGGLSVRDTLTQSGRQGTETVALANRSTINREPGT